MKIAGTGEFENWGQDENQWQVFNLFCPVIQFMQNSLEWCVNTYCSTSSTCVYASISLLDEINMKVTGGTYESWFQCLG